MKEVPSLFTLCLDSIKDDILYGDDDLSYIYDLPSEIFDSLLSRLPAMALQKLQDALPLNYGNEREVEFRCQRKRKRCENFQTAWMELFKSNFLGFRLLGYECCSKCVGGHDFENDWQGMFWNLHLQCCLDAAAIKAVLPNFEGSLGEIEIPDSRLRTMGYEQRQSNSNDDYSKLAYHCQHFGSYARYLMLRNVLLQAETSHLLRNSKLETLDLHWIKSREQVEGLCKLLSQNVETLISLNFSHCKLSSEFVNAICDSLHVKDLPTHRIHHFTINTSRFLEADTFSIPVGLVSFLSSARCLCTVGFHDNRLQQNSARTVFSALSDALSNIAVLDLSENNISGWLSDFKWKPSSNLHLDSGICKSLKSLRVLNLRGNNLQKDDADCLKCALLYMPNLEKLDLSDNPIADEGIMNLIPYFIRMAESRTSLSDLVLEDCKLTFHGVSLLLEVLSTYKKPLNSLNIGENNLTSKVGERLGKFICTGTKELYFQDIGLGSSGFLDVKEQIKEGLMLVSINISKNSGGVGAAEFISKLIVSAPELLKIDASFNFMPAESASIISSSLEIAKGKLKRLDLTGNPSCSEPASVVMLKNYEANARLSIVWPVNSLGTFYDDDP